MGDAPIRTLHCVPAVSVEASGPSYSVVRLCESLIAQGQPATLATLDWAPVASPQPFLERFPLGIGPRNLGRSPAMKRWLAQRAASGEVDVIHNHSLWMMPNVYPGEVAAKYGVRMVCSPRGTLSAWALGSGSPAKRIFWPLVQRPALRATTCFHATADSECGDIRGLGFRQPIALIPNGIDVPAALPRARGERRTLLFLGRIHPKKGLDMLLPAWAAVQARFPDWQVKVVGPDNAGGHLRAMHELAAKLKLERVEFAGALLGEAKWQAYRDADLFILPTYSENFGLAVAEALAAGVPAIVTHGAPWRGLEDHGAGWWPDTTTEALVASLENALGKPRRELDAMGERGRAWMQAEFSWQRVGAMMAQTYRWLLRGGSAPPWVRLD